MKITKDSFICKAAVFVLCKLLYRVRYEGLENIPESGPVILCSNHLSNADPIFISAKMPRIARFMAKKELFSVPILKGIIASFGAFPVDREHADISAIRKGLTYLKAGDMIGIFPQGTTHMKGRHPKQTPYKQGVGMLASRTGATILPACVDTKGYRLKLFQTITIRFGKPIPESEYHAGDHTPEAYERIAALAYDRICELLP